MGFTIEIDTKAVKAKFDAAKHTLAGTMSNELNKFAILSVNEAKIFTTPNVNLGFLRNSIHFEASTPETLRVEIAVSANYAAFIEFGTGIFAASYVPTLPQQWQKLAKTFYISGKGRGKQHPFLFPAIEINIEKLKDRLK